MPTFFSVAETFRGKRIGLRTFVPMVAAALVSASPLAAARVFIPNCCNNPAALTVLDPATGRIKAMLDAGPGGPYEQTTNVGMALTGNGKAAVLSEVGTKATTQSFAVHLLDLSTAEVVATSNSVGGPLSLAKNPVYQLLYVWYADPTTGISHIQELNLDTLDLIQDVTVSYYGAGPLIVSPDGNSIFGPSKSGLVILDALSLKTVGSVSLPAQGFPVAISPDGATLYAADTEASPFVFVIDIPTLQVTNSVGLGPIFYYDEAGQQPGALSPDGSQLYLTAFQSIVTIDTRTLQITNTATPGFLSNIVVSPQGAVYLGVRAVAALIDVFDPSSQSISATFRVPGENFLAVSPTGNDLYILPESASGVAVASASPSGQIQRVGVMGELDGYGAYDSADRLVLLPDITGGIDVLDANTLEFKGFTPIPSRGSTWVVYGDTGYAAIPASIDSGLYTLIPQIARFDPVKLRTTAVIDIPSPLVANSTGFTQPAIEGTNLYAPFNFAYVDCCAAPGDRVAPAGQSSEYGIAVVDTTTFTLTRIISLNVSDIVGINGFAIAPGTGKAYASISGFGGAFSLLEIDLDSGKILRSTHLPRTSFLAASPDGSTIYMSSNELLAISTDTLTIVNAAPDLALDYLTITPDGKYLCGPVFAGAVIVDSATLQIVASIPGQQDPPVGAPIILPN